MKIKANSKNILKEIFLIILTGLVVLTMYSILFLSLYLISDSSRNNSEFIPLIRYIENTYLVAFIYWAAYGIYLLIASRFWIAGIVIGSFSTISVFITAIPNYLILSKLGYANIFISILEPMIIGLSIVIVSVLVKATKNRTLAFLIGYGMLITFGMTHFYLENIVIKILICSIPLLMFFIEKVIHSILISKRKPIEITI